MSDFFTGYMDYVQLDGSEAPANYHRWACASMIGALLGRQAWLPFGSSKIYTNQYIMLMGPPATKKGTSIGIAKDLMRGAGYARFAADRTSKESFIREMKQVDTMEEDLEMLTFDAPAESYITSGEFVDFIGQGDIGFLMLLTNLWDNLDEYKHPKITGSSVKITKPTVNLLSGSTATTFNIAFPPEAIGTGSLSRFLLIHGEPSGRRVAWPEPQDPLVREMIIDHLKDIKSYMAGEMKITPEAKLLAKEIYENRVAVADARFTHYMERRHIHMIKLAMIMAATNLSMVVERLDMLRANTMLAMAERLMPKALGQFGASRMSPVANKVLDAIVSKSKRSVKPSTPTELFQLIATDVGGMKDLNDILVNLKNAGKIQILNVKGVAGYAPLFQEAEQWKEEFLDLNWLTQQEKPL